jgi:hypothetical protein
MRKYCACEKKIICQNLTDSHVISTSEYETGDLKRPPSASLPLCLSVYMDVPLASALTIVHSVWKAVPANSTARLNKH